MKRHANLSIFVPHLGCPYACVFCDQKNISGEQRAPTPDEIRDMCDAFLPQDGKNTEIAFFGGSFTAIERSLMVSMLEAAYPFVRSGRACGIRCSTRPDAIDDEILDILKGYGVTSIELGAQSMNDEVLRKNGRGHDAQSVREASALIRKHGFSLGLQMMVGMYGDADRRQGAVRTAEELITLRPDTVRIYPTLVLDRTPLAVLYRTGRYEPLGLEEAVDITSELITMFRNENINVIRVGLHYEDSLKADYLAGPFHPAFGEMCEAMIFRRKMEDMIGGRKTAVFACEPRLLSQVQGQKRSNIGYFREKGISVSVVPEEGIRGIALK